jgi:transposase InsO family protein
MIHLASGLPSFLPVTDLLFRQIYAFFIVELATRRVVHAAVTRHPADAWVAQQLREATAFGEHPIYLIRDNDSKFGPAFARVAENSGVTIVRTAYRAPLMNAVCERFLGSVRRECLDHLLILGEAHLRRALRAYVRYFNEERSHQGIAQDIPVRSQTGASVQEPRGRVEVVPMLGGLHHTYRRGA